MLAKLLPLHRAVAWHREHPEASRLLPLHAQLYAELVASVPGLGGLSEECLPPNALTEARRRVQGGAALPLALHKEYRELAQLSSACVALLSEYRSSDEPRVSVPLRTAYRALPPHSVCERARQVLKRWLRDADEREVITGEPWSPSLDAELVEAATVFTKRLGKRSLTALTKSELTQELAMLKSGAAAYDSLLVKCVQVVRMPVARATQRWLVLCRFNLEVERLLPLAYTGCGTSEPHTLGSRLCALRSLIFMEVKRRVWDAALPEGPADEGVVKAGHVISLNRFEAEAARSDGPGGGGGSSGGGGPSAAPHHPANCKTLFEQSFSQLHSLPSTVLRRRDRAFKVKFIGEGSDDYGGPFREAITNMCAELQRHGSPLFVLTPNGVQGSGDNRSAYTIRPSTSSSPARLAQFAFLGKLLGCAMLQREMVLDLELSDHVWKRLAGVALSELDLSSFDQQAYASFNRLRTIEDDGVDESSFSELFFNAYEVELSDGATVELIEDGSATDVTFATRHRFVELAIAARLAEGAAQCEAVLSGLASVVPSARLLTLMTGHELQRLACGEADVDVKQLRLHTSYGATAAASMPHVRYFWAVLESFTPEQRRTFLKFIWGRNRLPLTEEDWGEQRMRIHTLDKPNPNAYFPVAHTCFFSIELPRYTSRDVCYKKLLWAINNCQSIDADNTREGRANAESNAFLS